MRVDTYARRTGRTLRRETSSVLVASSLQNQHRVAVAVEAIPGGDGVTVGAEHALAAGKGGHQHQERGLRQVKVRNQSLHDPEGMPRADKQLRFSRGGHDIAGRVELQRL